MLISRYPNLTDTVFEKAYSAPAIAYDSGGFIYDMRNKGAYLGVGIRF